MKVDIPILVHQRPAEDQQESSFFVRPLFAGASGRAAARLDRAIARLSNDVREHLNTLAREPLQDPLAEALFNPPIEVRRIKAELFLRRRTLRGAWHAVIIRVGEESFGFTTDRPEAWIHLPSGVDVLMRFREILTARAQKAERAGDPLPEPTEGRVWSTSISVSVAAEPSFKQEKIDLAGLFGGSAVGSGAEELPRVGRSVDALHPEGFLPSKERNAEIDELAALLDRDDRPSVLLVGPHGVGKTALVHACVRGRIDAAGGRVGERRQTWEVSPPRLVAGMSFVGQWEQRCLAIFEHAKKQDHALLVDDVLGLFSAGRTSESNVTVGHALKPFVERRDVRVIGELTPEAFAALRELDRGFADLFHVLHVAEPEAPRALRMLVTTVREVERRQGCAFDLDVLPVVLDLANRYVRGAALPGRAAALLQQLGARHVGRTITRADAMAAFRERSGLHASFVDGDVRLDQAQVVAGLGLQVFGQRPAIKAMAEVVGVAKARLGDPRRPLGSLLFLGPTGVGKTECAKALATLLFGDSERLLRFDMNSFNDRGAAARLVGTRSEPDGQLTAAVRRQPFCVLLLDEIEKADPGVHDLLLQVLGEGRLTDAIGRTADFGNAIVLLTSNLGAERAMAGPLGFGRAGAASDPGGSASTQTEAFVEAARDFFRPELFNRFDRIVPFAPLSRRDVGQVAERLLGGLLRRDGLRRRHCVLSVAPEARAWLVDRGFDPRFGARAIRRTVEEQVARPVARRLAALPAHTPVVIEVERAANGLAVESTPVVPADRLHAPPFGLLGLDRADLLAAMKRSVERHRARARELQAATGALVGSPTPAQLGRLALEEELTDVEEVIERLARASAPRGMQNRLASLPIDPDQRRGFASRKPERPSFHWRPAPPDAWARILRFDRAGFHLKQLTTAPFGSPTGASKAPLALEQPAGFPGDLLEAIAQLSWAEATSHAAEGGEAASTASLVFRGVGTEDAAPLDQLGALLAEAFRLPWGLESAWHAGDGAGGVLTVEGPGAATLVAAESGTHGCVDEWGSFKLFSATPALTTDAVAALAMVKQAEREERAARVAGGTAAASQPLATDPPVPGHLCPVHRLTDAKLTTLDLRTGLMTSGGTTARDLMMFCLAPLPLPVELEELIS